MNLSDAVDLLRPAVPKVRGAWADLGAGEGLFTRALAELAGSGSATIWAVDRDAGALAVLRDSSADLPSGVTVHPLAGDFRELARIPELTGQGLEGALFANALHFVPEPVPVLAGLAPTLVADGCVVVVEYHGRPANPWVPHPIPIDALERFATEAGYHFAGVRARRPSVYGGYLYSARLERARPG